MNESKRPNTEDKVMRITSIIILAIIVIAVIVCLAVSCSSKEEPITDPTEVATEVVEEIPSEELEIEVETESTEEVESSETESEEESEIESSEESTEVEESSESEIIDVESETEEVSSENESTEEVSSEDETVFELTDDNFDEWQDSAEDGAVVSLGNLRAYYVRGDRVYGVLSGDSIETRYVHLNIENAEENIKVGDYLNIISATYVKSQILGFIPTFDVTSYEIIETHNR